MKKHQDLYDQITDKIIKQLEAGVIPWLRPWDKKEAAHISGQLAMMPMNRVSARAYSGINAILLWCEAYERGWEQPLEFVTYRQAEELGGHVRKGEEATMIVFLGEAPKKDWQPPADDPTSTKGKWYKFLKKYWVFHWSQCEGVKPREQRPRNTVAMTEPGFNAFVASTGANIKVGGTRACYVPSLDFVAMPPLGSFVDAGNYKSVLCHELCHWTGHVKRLARDLTGGFGSHKYAREELIAEIGSAFLCAQLGIEGKLRHAEYLGSWIKTLQEDSKAVVQAAAGASRAADYLLATMAQPIARNRALVPIQPEQHALAMAA